MKADDCPWIHVLGKKPSSSFFVFIGNITFDTTADDINRIFRRYGKIMDVFLPTDRIRHRPRGFGFVRYRYEQDAINAKKCLHGRRVDGRIITVERAKSQNDAPSPSLPIPKPTLLEQLNPIPPLGMPFPPPPFLDKAFSRPASPAERMSSNTRGPEISAPFSAHASKKEVDRLLRQLVATLIVSTKDAMVSIVHLTDSLRKFDHSLAKINITRVSALQFLFKFHTK
ncbi:uncharacterized protein LOC131225080 [Magnolia sinica]|uniref:uncharacterized protein LOC131225080 n=1 Tax=Magnolia sinica TaxID=86752 RepID=UPI002659D458|nr:uncharacterized protein LOC131225080 [Magnolia sinica]